MSFDTKYRCWLLLSTKRPNDDMVWYADGSAGYTVNLLTAGRFTEAEAKAEQARVPHYLTAVHIDDAMSMAKTWVTVANGTAQMGRLRKKCADRERKAVPS